MDSAAVLGLVGAQLRPSHGCLGFVLCATGFMCKDGLSGCIMRLGSNLFRTAHAAQAA